MVYIDPSMLKVLIVSSLVGNANQLYTGTADIALHIVADLYNITNYFNVSIGNIYVICD